MANALLHRDPHRDSANTAVMLLFKETREPAEDKRSRLYRWRASAS
jgi:hypothetical protein